MFPAVFLANIHKYQLFPVPSDFVIVPPDVNVVLNVFYLDNTAPNTTAPTATSTTNSIVVTSAQADSNSGIDASTRQYSIKKTSDSSW